MKRIMVNLDGESGRLIEERARHEKRSASSYIAILIERDLRASGLINANPHAEILSYANSLGATRALSALKRAARTKRTAA